MENLPAWSLKFKAGGFESFCGNRVLSAVQPGSYMTGIADPSESLAS
jgi:hypothetical protein